jgi:hypothetical protein
MKTKQISIFVILLLVSSMLVFAADDIPGNIQYVLPTTQSSKMFLEPTNWFTNLFNSLFSIVLPKTTFTDSETVSFSQSETTWQVTCNSVKQISEVYQNAIKKDGMSVNVGSVSGTNKAFSITGGYMDLTAGTYGIIGWLYCADSYTTFAANNGCTATSTGICADYRTGTSQRISNTDSQSFTVVGSCVPQTEICNQKDDDCDGAVDELGVCTPACLPQYSQKCYANDVWFYDSCNVRTTLANDCSSSETCSNGACIAAVVPCTSFTYSAWSTCSSSGTQTRTILTSSPTSCTGGSPVLSQTCTAPTTTCTSFTYSSWSPATCPANSKQVRTIATSLPSGCTGGNALLEQSCTYVAPCASSWTCGPWSNCASGSQTRICQDANSCVTPNPANPETTSQSCSITCSPDWQCSDWSSCSFMGNKARTCTDANSCGTTDKPIESESCNYYSSTQTNTTQTPKNETTQQVTQTETPIQLIQNPPADDQDNTQIILFVIVLGIIGFMFIKRKKITIFHKRSK